MRALVLGLAALTALAACGDEDRTSAFGTVTATTSTSTTAGASTSSSGDATTPATDAASGPAASSGTTAAPSCAETGCPRGQYCDAGADACAPGCADDVDCAAPAVCDGVTHTCVACVLDGDCPLGQVCSAGACAPGCTDTQPCQGGLACCAGACVDPLTDLAHCGGCGAPCPDLANAAETCVLGACGLGDCADGFADCDQDASDGCEVQGPCQCVPGAQEPCYTGPPDAPGVGPCAEGVRTCDAQGTGWGACAGEVLPGDLDVCGNGVDDDCDGQIDEDPDGDKDGWTVCGGDCCDELGPACLNPALVNPGAFDVPGNTVDDDCDGKIDNVLAACDGGLPSDSSDPLHYAKAIDLCQFTTENPPSKLKRWGVISGAFTRSSGAGAPAANARAIRPGFGAIAPQKNARVAVLSTGNAADGDDTSPPYAPFQGGTALGTDAAVPTDWLAANGNDFPNAPGCPEPQGGAIGRDTILLKLRIRAPTNALSFSARVYMLSSEYPEWVCSPANDFFLALVDGLGAGNPSDRNIAVYKNNQNQVFPLGVNLLRAAAGLFARCKNGPVGCGTGAVPGTYNGCTGNADLVGTGMDLLNPAPKFFGDPGYCDTNNQVGGGTGWLKMSGNVKPGETLELRFVLWDTGDAWYDSVVLLDDFAWSIQASKPGVTPG